MSRSEYWLPGWRNRRHRRPFVAVLGAGLAVMAAAVVVGDVEITDNPLWYVGTVTTLAAWGLLRVLTGGVAERWCTRLDERERTLRDRYAYSGFNLAIIFLMAMFVVLAVAQNVPALQARAPGLAFLLGCVAGALPTTRLGWNLPDEDPEDVAGLEDVRQS